MFWMYHPSTKCIINGTFESWISHLTVRVGSSEYPEALQVCDLLHEAKDFRPSSCWAWEGIVGPTNYLGPQALDTHLVVSTFIAHHAETIPYISQVVTSVLAGTYATICKIDNSSTFTFLRFEKLVLFSLNVCTESSTLYCSFIIPISKGSNTFHAFDVEREVWSLDIWSPPDQTEDEKYCCYWQV